MPLPARNPRIPQTLDLATWTRALVDSYRTGRTAVNERVAILSLADDLKVNEKTVRAWMDSAITKDGPSVHVNTDNFDALCAIGRLRGFNIELFELGPEIWRPEYCGNEHRFPLPPLIDVGRKFIDHGRRLAGEYLSAPLIVTGGPFSTEPEQIRWLLNSGFSGAETKSKLSHERQCRRSDVILSLTEAPEFDGAYPRKRPRLLVGSFDRNAIGNGLGARLGAPSNAPSIWIPRFDHAISQTRSGEVLILSIAAHVRGNPARRCSTWEPTLLGSSLHCLATATSG